MCGSRFWAEKLPPPHISIVFLNKWCTLISIVNKIGLEKLVIGTKREHKVSILVRFKRMFGLFGVLTFFINIYAHCLCHKIVFRVVASISYFRCCCWRTECQTHNHLKNNHVVTYRVNAKEGLSDWKQHDNHDSWQNAHNIITSSVHQIKSQEPKASFTSSLLRIALDYFYGFTHIRFWRGENLSRRSFR